VNKPLITLSRNAPGLALSEAIPVRSTAAWALDLKGAGCIPAPASCQKEFIRPTDTHTMAVGSGALLGRWIFI
jgi:hypothetical protein